jgi:hypothetical protein
MESLHKTFKWLRIAGILAMLASFVLVPPSYFAQEETPPTAIPYGTPQGNEILSLSQVQSTSPLGGDWSAQVNISDTIEESSNPKIAVDNTGVLHFVWRETIGGKQEIFYSRFSTVQDLLLLAG